jgi:peroxiredoxin
MFDTVRLKNRTYNYFNYTDIDGKEQIRDSINQKPCLIYYFASTCSPCLFEMVIYNDLYKKYIGKIDFFALTPDTKESINKFCAESEIPKFSIISLPRSYFHGFPVAFILDEKNKIVLFKSGGSMNEEMRAIDCNILTEWCEKVLSNDKVKTEHNSSN